MNKQAPPLTDQTEKMTTLDELHSLCQNETWFAEFIQDTENYRMVKAPSHMKEELLERLSHPPSSLLPTEALSLPVPEKPLSKRMELFIYSLRVSVAAMGAIIVLLLTPPSLELLHTSFSQSVMEFSNVFYHREVSPND